MLCSRQGILLNWLTSYYRLVGFFSLKRFLRGLRLFGKLCAQSFCRVWLFKTWSQTCLKFIRTLSDWSTQWVDRAFLQRLHRLHFWIFVQIICCVHSPCLRSISSDLTSCASSADPCAAYVQRRFRVFKKHAIRRYRKLVASFDVQVWFACLSITMPNLDAALGHLNRRNRYLISKLDSIASACSIEQLFPAIVIELYKVCVDF